ncbi:MAG: sigma-70 family RNA polymerase sigma factor [Eggerthellaceae bacterium]|nr:sigma-70 family RNA polymerase sigma factor [Eggerthellaceae bacterium]
MDVLLLLACKRGDEGALARIIDKYAAYVSTVVYNIIGASMTREDVEEVASDVFFAFWRNADKTTAPKLKAYLGRIARNKAINKLRGFREDLPFEDDWVSVSEPSSEEALSEREERARVRKALSEMSETDRRIFLLYYYDCCSVTDIASKTGMGVEAIKKRLVRGRAKLQKLLYEGGDINGEKNIRPVKQSARS